MADHTGIEKHEWKAKADRSDAIVVQSSPATNKQWVTIDRFEKDELALGQTHFAPELAGWIAGIKKNNIKTEWVRVNGPGTGDDDDSKRHGHAVGTESSWTSTGGGGTEYLSEGDLPYELRIWQDMGSVLLVTKVIVKTHNPKAEIAYDLRAG